MPKLNDEEEIINFWYNNSQDILLFCKLKIFQISILYRSLSNDLLIIEIVLQK